MFDLALLARIEDASLNASAPPEQRWIDGWLVRVSPGKARRARCVNALAVGRMPLAEKLRLAAAVYEEAGLPMLVRITPFSQPSGLDESLGALGWTRIDPTPVLVRRLPLAMEPSPSPSELRWETLDAGQLAETVGALRGSTASERSAHAERLRLSPTPYRGYALVDATSGAVLACGQFAREGSMVGVYDVFTAEHQRRRGLASLLCERLLSFAARERAATAYLQVSEDNDAAQRVYRRLGFADGYVYHYRAPPGGG